MKPWDLMLDGVKPGRALITSRAETTEAVKIVLGKATRLVRAMQTDLSPFEFSSVAMIERIEALMLSHRNARVRLLVDQPDWLETRAARLRLLQRRYSHALEMRVASGDDPVGDEACVIADSHSIIELRPSAQARGDLWLHHEPRVQPIANGFDRRWESAAHNLAVVPLGLG